MLARGSHSRMERDAVGASANTNETEWTFSKLLSWTAQHLASRGVDEPRLAAEVLLAHANSCQRIDLYARFDKVPEEEELVRFRECVKRAGDHEPIAYLVGQKEFFSLSFRVTRDVLIPRPETETLVACVLDYCKNSIQSPRILDVGTGSGCIAIAIQKHLADAQVFGSDCSTAALTVAGENAEKHGIAQSLTLCEADCLSLPSDIALGFDVIVSNPPYVAKSEFGELNPAVREFEPRIALTDEDDGVSFYRRIATESPDVLAPNGAVFVEIGAGQKESVVESFEGTRMFDHSGTWQDSVVGLDRVLMFSKRAE